MVSFTATFLGGLAGLWWLTERAQHGMDFFVAKSPDGTYLNGNYKINSWMLFLNFLVIFLPAMVCFALVRELRRSRPEIRDLARVRAIYGDMLNFARNITATNLFQQGRPRVNIDRTHERHLVSLDGSAQVTRTYDISCPTGSAHAFEIWIEADDESDPLQAHRGMNLRAYDRTCGRELDWIPTHDTLRKKNIAIYFPEMKNGETKQIEIQFQWPGWMRRVLDKGSTEFWWSHRAATENATAHVSYQWIFVPGFPHVRIRLRGNHSDSARLYPDHPAEGFRWTYEDPTSPIDKREYKVLVELPTQVERYD